MASRQGHAGLSKSPSFKELQCPKALRRSQQPADSPPRGAAGLSRQPLASALPSRLRNLQTPSPPFNGVRPYQKTPFRYSLLIQQQPGAEPEHFEYLAPPNIDPRRELSERLLAAIPADACVLRDLTALFPDLAEAIETRLVNVRNLMVPFKKRHVYRWPMRGSYSIKDVLPALVPEMSYEGMEIANGMVAMQAYREKCALEPGQELERLRAAMLEYCRLDTLAMVRILEILGEE